MMRPIKAGEQEVSEYQNVEKPFLDQLAALGWQVIDQGAGFPTDPAKSLRPDFKTVLLKDAFNQGVRNINRTPDGRPWLTDKQLDELYDQLVRPPGHSLVEINETVLQLLFRAQTDVNQLTGEEDPNVRLIDFQQPELNQFLAINQFRIDTPGGVKHCIIPDIVLFVNGMPLVVVECKDAHTLQAKPLYEAFRQLMRYTDQRPATREAALREGAPRLFYTNQFLVRTTGEHAEFGTITSTEEEYFYPWRDIYPEKYRRYQPPRGTERQQELLIQGMLPKETLLDIVRTCTVFLDLGPVRAKIVCRYQQYRAVQKILHRLRHGKTPAERSGVIWHTQGSGKSLTIVFLVRKLRMCEDLKDLKVCLINDRTDLEHQLGATAALTGEQVTYVRSTEELRTRLATDASNLNMVMVHKFQELRDRSLPDCLQSVLEIPRFETFGVVNSSERILLCIDEAHRTQSGDLGDNLFEAFPNATRLAFTGTPLIVVKDRQQTVARFGQYIDKYKLQDAVDDGATVQILYEGKTADAGIAYKVTLDDRIDRLAEDHVNAQLAKEVNQERLRRQARGTDRPFDDLVRERTDEEILELKKKWGTNGDILEADARIEAIAGDLVNHYLDNILPNGFKAQVVCSSKLAAVKYRRHIDRALAARLAAEQAKPVWNGHPAGLLEEERATYRDEALCRKIGFLKSVVVVSSEGTNELAAITAERRRARELHAVPNFKRPFNFDDPEKVNTGVAFLIVCDMLLTGFDAPVEQVMYLDKKVRDHSLLQTIARVNRVARGKSRGYIVDYIGLAQHLHDALSIYAVDDRQDIENTLTDIWDELPVLEDRYRRLLQLFADQGISGMQDFAEQKLAKSEEAAVLEQAVQLLEDIKLRADFEVYLKKFMQSMDIVLPHAAASPYRVPVKRFGYLLARVRARYKDESLDISGAGEKVRKLIDEHLVSLGIDPKIPPVKLLSPEFVSEVDKSTTPRAKASEMEHALRKHCKVHFEEDPALYEKLSQKLEALLQQYRDNWDQLCQKLLDLRAEAAAGRQEEIEGVGRQAAPFYDLIGQIAFGGEIPPQHVPQVKKLVAQVLERLIDTIGIVDFWRNDPEIASLRGNLTDLMLFSGVDQLVSHREELVTEIAALAKVRHRDILA